LRPTDNSVTELAGNEIAARIPVGPDTKRLILGADEAYVPGYDGSVRIIGPPITGWRSKTTAGTGLSPDGGRLYVAASRLSAYGEYCPGEDHPEHVALSGDGEVLYVADDWTGTITAISIPSALRDTQAV
jgi:DNA-binding beta-propeller fold protein YncE